MALDAAFGDVGLSFDSNPPLLDRRHALAMAYGEEAGSQVSLAALEIERFAIPAESERKRVRGEVVGAWHAITDALGQLSEELEVWHVMAARSAPGLDGSLLRAGWVFVGRGADRPAAVRKAEHTFQVLRSILAAHISFATLRPVAEGAALADLARPWGAPFAVAFRRERWAPPTRAEREGERPSRRPSTLLPWAAREAEWQPIAVSLAAQPAALVVRLRTAARAAEAALDEAERDVLDVANEQMRAGGGIFRNAAPGISRNEPGSGFDVAAVSTTLKLLQSASEQRLRALQRRCLAIDVALTSAEPVGPGLRAITAGVLAPTPAESEDDKPGRPLPVANPVRAVELGPGEIRRPVDGERHPGALVSPAEAACLFRTAEPPTDERSPLPCSRAQSLPVRATPSRGNSLGDSELHGRWVEVRLEETARFQHVYVVGQTGTGKSTLLLHMIAGDMAAGRGVTVLDPHGTLIADVLARVPPERAGDVILVDPNDTEFAVGLNPLRLPDLPPARFAAARDRVLDELMDTFDALYDLKTTGGPMFEQVFRTFCGLMIGARYRTSFSPTLQLLEPLMRDHQLTRRLAAEASAEDPTVATRIETILDQTGETALRNMIPYVNSKMIRFYGPAQARMVLCQPSCLDFDRVVRERKILLVELSPLRLGAEAAALIGRQIVLKLALAAMSRDLAVDATAHFLYADEFHTFATERFAQLLSEARKYRLALVLAHQYTSQLVRRDDRRVLDAILGNVGTMVAFRLGTTDAELLGDAMAPRATPRDIVGLPNFSAVVRSAGELGNVPFTLRTRPPSGGAGTDVGVLRDAARRREATPRQEIEQAIRANLEAFLSLGPGRAAPRGDPSAGARPSPGQVDA